MSAFLFSPAAIAFFFLYPRDIQDPSKISLDALTTRRTESRARSAAMMSDLGNRWSGFFVLFSCLLNINQGKKCIK